MSVNVTKTSSTTAEITWEPGDDPSGRIARAVEGDQLAYALEALGSATGVVDEPEGTPERDALAAMHTLALADELKRRSTAQVVRLRDVHGMSWRQIAEAVYRDADKHSHARRAYDSGRLKAGNPVKGKDNPS